jgi:hypothetical protein
LFLLLYLSKNWFSPCTRHFARRFNTSIALPLIPFLTLFRNKPGRYMLGRFVYRWLCCSKLTNFCFWNLQQISSLVMLLILQSNTNDPAVDTMRSGKYILTMAHSLMSCSCYSFFLFSNIICSFYQK